MVVCGLDDLGLQPDPHRQLSVRAEDIGGREAEANSEISNSVAVTLVESTRVELMIWCNRISSPIHTTMVALTLTKKQQKAQAFRAGKGKKDRAEPEDVPEQDVLPDEEEPVPAAEATESAEYKAKSKSKKSKEKKLKEKLAKEGTDGPATSVKPAKSEKAKGKEKEVVKDGEDAKADAVEGEEKPAKKTKKDIKQRFILFVGEYMVPLIPPHD